MYIVISEYNINYVYILPSKCNYVIKHSRYNKILYSNEYITLNGLYIPIQLDNVNYFEKYNKCFIRFTNNLHHIIKLEKELLSKYNNNNKHHNTIIKTAIENKRFVTNSRHPITSNYFILYISGLWVSKYELGLIYKVIPSNRPSPKNTY